MRVLIVTQDFPPHVGGIQTYQIEMARGLHKRCAALAVVAPWTKGCEDVDRELPFAVHRVRCGPHGLLPFLGTGRIRAIARAFGPDIVFYGQWQTGGTSAWMRAQWPRCKIVVPAYARELQIVGPPIIGALMRRFRAGVFRGADAVAAISRFTAGLCADVGVDRKRVHIIPCGTDPTRFRPGDGAAFRARHGLGSGPLVLSVGRLMAHKGIDTVVSAMPTVLKEVPAARFAIGGRGPDEARLRALAASFGVAERVHFLGPVASAAMCECYSACDVFVTASRAIPPSIEGYGIVFLEAGACGRPVIGTNSGGIPDAIVEGETGFLVPPNDSAALAEKIVTVLKDKALGDRMGAAGRRRVETELNWDSCAARLFELFASL